MLEVGVKVAVIVALPLPATVIVEPETVIALVLLEL